MPALYAHDRFGVKVREQMNAELARTAFLYDSAYRTGLQGPDIFFFYHPWGKNRVQRYGSHLHETNAAPFFRHAISVIRKYGRESSEYAYLLGFICHFTLDSECHPYIEGEIERIGVAHLEIEAEFEKSLLSADGLSPIGFRTAGLVHTDAETAAAIEPFYPSINQKTVQESLKDMKLVKCLFTAPNPLKQGVINTVMRAAGVYHEMNGLMNQRRDNPLCAETNRELTRIFDASVALAARLQEEFDDCLRTGKKLPDRFHRTFE